jgi:hypothetical protein
MSIIATSEATSKLEIIETGSHIATCVQMIHIGTVSDEFEGKPVKGNKVRITFELPGLMVKFKEDEPEQPRFISKEFTLSLGSKASLRKFLDTWRGKPFTEDEARAFDVTNLLGVSCMLSIGSKTSAKGQAYNTIDSALALPKGIPAPEQITPTIEVNYDNISDTWKHVPKYLREKMELTPEFINSGFSFPAEENEVSNEPIEETEETNGEPKKKDLPF